MRVACKHGHPWTEETTRAVVSRPGVRICVLCERASGVKRRSAPGYNKKARKYSRVFYDRHPEKLKEQARKSCVRRRKVLEGLKAGKSCIKCGESHMACLDFHHRDPSTKDFQITEGVFRYAIEKVLAETEKCDILCANCHRKHHYAQVTL